MGGGDLNLKKSWHPSTLRNIERVWKAEQKHEAEKQKIEQLQKELAEERAREEIQTYAEDQGVVKKKEEKLDWMYAGPAAMVNKEEYLLGRKIDSTFERMQQVELGKTPEDDTSDVSTSLFSSQGLSGSATVDLANKIREDPLFNIMKKEKEQRKNLLTNPVKMKQLQQMLKASLTEKASKKNKKSKKKKHREVDSDDEAPQKRRKHKKHHSSDSDNQPSSKESRKTSKTKHHRDESPDYKDSKYDPASDRRQKYSSSYHKEFTSHHEHSHKYDYNRQSSRRNHYDKEYENKSSHSKRSQETEPMPHKSQKYASQKYQNNSSPKKKMDASERDRLLREMEENAKWREEKRKQNVIRYKEEDEKEDRVKRIDSSDFMKPMLSKAAGKGSLENRVKQKIFSIQRSSSAMDKNFARRD